MSLAEEMIENTVKYKPFTLEELEQVIKEIDKDGWLDRWDHFWVMQSTSFKEEFDKVMKEKVKKYCDGV